MCVSVGLVALLGPSFSWRVWLIWWAIFLPYAFAGPSRLARALSMAAAIASDARATAVSSVALCWANVWILVSSLPLGFSLGPPVSGGGEGEGV